MSSQASSANNVKWEEPIFRRGQEGASGFSGGKKGDSRRSRLVPPKLVPTFFAVGLRIQGNYHFHRTLSPQVA